MQVTLARACQVAYTGLLCLFTCLALFPVCLLRATMGPGVGIFSNLGVGVTILQGQVTWSAVHGYRLLWKEVYAMHHNSVWLCWSSRLFKATVKCALFGL